MQVNTDSVAILTKQILKSEVEVLKSIEKMDGWTHCRGSGQSPVKVGAPRWLGDIAQMRGAVYVLENRIKELEGAGV